MKTLVIFIFIALFAQYTTAQKIKMSRMDSLAYDLSYTKFSIGKFKSQLTTGLVVSSLGFLTIATGNALIGIPFDSKITSPTEMKKMYDDHNKKIMIINGVGGALILFGSFMSIDSYSWLRRASIKPSQYGVSFTIDLDSDE